VTRMAATEHFWAKVCFKPKYKPQGRYHLYRELVTDRMLQILQNVCPVTNEILTEAEWLDLLWEFLEKSPPQSEILRDLPYEFSAYLKSHRHRLFKRYPFLGELIEYEAMEVKVSFAPNDRSHTPKGKVRMNPAHFLGKYCWPVHFLDKDFRQIKKIPKGEYHLLLWRDPKDDGVKFMEVNALVASLIQHLKKGPQVPKNLLQKIAKENGFAATGEFLAEGRILLADLEKKKILVP